MYLNDIIPSSKPATAPFTHIVMAALTAGALWERLTGF